MFDEIRGSNSGASSPAAGFTAASGKTAAAIFGCGAAVRGKTAAAIFGCGTAAVRGKTAAAILVCDVGSSQYDLLQLEPKNKS